MAVNVLVAVTVLWCILVVVAGALFAFFGLVIRDDLITSRYPVIAFVNLACLFAWVLMLLQRSGLHLLYDSPLPTFVPWYWHCFVLPTTTNLFAVCLAVRGVTMACDMFQTKKLAHEASAKDKEFMLKQHLTPLEQLFFRALARLMRSQQVMGQRRFSTSAQTYTILGSLCYSVFIQIPIGMLWSGCFDPAVGMDKCTDDEHMRGFFHIDHIVFLMVAPVLTLVFWMLRNLRDPLCLREELIFAFLACMGMFCPYLTSFYFNVPDFNDPLKFFFPVLLALPAVFLGMYCMPIFLCIRRQVKSTRTVGLTRSEESFQRLLKDKHLFEELKKTMAASFSLENGLFWEEVTQLEHTASTLDHQEIQDALHRLYFDYVASGAPRELNLTSGTRAKVVADFRACCLTLQTFVVVRKEVYDIMLHNSFPQLIGALKAREGSISMRSASNNPSTTKSQSKTHAKATPQGIIT